MKKNILVVDDDNDILRSIKDVFEHQGHEVLIVKNGVECIEVLEKGFKGIVFMDIMMPEMDGWDTLKEIINRGLEKNIDIFIITAIGTHDHEKIKGLEPYIRDYITKPFDINNLVKNIKKIN